MGLPVIKIDFKQLTGTAVERSQRGVVALILKDVTQEIFTVMSKGDISNNLSEDNKQLVRETLIGNVYSPRKVLVYVIAEGKALSDALAYFETQEFNVICMPNASESDNTAIDAFVDRMAKVVNYKVQAVLKDKASNNKYISNFTAKNIVVGGVEKTDYAHRYAGLLCGTPLHQSVTFAELPEVDSVEVLTKEQADTRINNGEVILVREMGKIRVARGVNSLKTSSEGDDFKKTKIIAITNLIHNDLRKVLVEKYIGKVPNSYVNKLVLISEIKGYLDGLAIEQLIETDPIVDIDIDAQKTYLKSINVNVDSMTDAEIKAYNTKDKVFLAISIKLIDSIEDITINVAI